MTSLSWYTLLFATLLFLGGSALGALAYAFIAAYRHRKPKIGCRVDRAPLFESLSGTALPRAQIEISDGEQTYSYNQLQLVQVQVQNQSKQDFDHFEFGLTLAAQAVIIQLEVQTADRHHRVQQLEPSTFSQPQAKADLSLQPFNRDDTYTLRLLCITAQPNQRLGEITFSSPVAVRFVDMPLFEETLKDSVKSTTISLGPFSFSFD
jgi:hypothetical protein